MSPTLTLPRSLTHLARFAVLLTVAGSVGAQTVVYDNLVTSGSSMQQFVNISKIGQSFTPSVSGTLSSITLNLTTQNTSAPTYSVELWSNNGATSLPSSLLATFVSNQPWSGVFSGTTGSLNAATTVTFSSGNFGQNYSLSAGTPYWLVVTTSMTGVARAWGVGAAGDDFAAVFNVGFSSWESKTFTGGATLGAQITMGGSAIPEPSTYAAFAGAACLVFAGYSRRANRNRNG